MKEMVALDIILLVWAVITICVDIMTYTHQKKNKEKYKKAEKELLLAEANALKALLYAEMHKAYISNETSADRCKDAYDNLYTVADNFKYWWKG